MADDDKNDRQLFVGLVRQAEAARRAGVTPQTITYWVKAGKVDTVRFNDGTAVIKAPSLDAYIEKRRRKKQATAEAKTRRKPKG